MPKGRRSSQGIGDIWTEPKKRVNLALTPTAIQSLDAKASEYGISRSEVVERFARNLIEATVEPKVNAENLVA